MIYKSEINSVRKTVVTRLYGDPDLDLDNEKASSDLKKST